jgi:hypothetical protein
MVDLEFSKHVLVITQRELVAVSDKFHLSVWKATEVRSILIFRKMVGLTLDETEFESVTLRDLERQLGNGDCYFSYDIDLTNGLQRGERKGSKQRSQPCLDFSHLDQKFFWNRHLLGPLLSDECHQFIVPLVSGFVGSVMLYESSPVNVILLSRLSTEKAGTRYWSRGVDAKGNVAIEVETDVIAITPQKTASYRLVRGSVPLMWSQHQLHVIREPSVNLNEILSPPSIQGLRFHFDRLKSRYGGGIDIVDLIDREATKERFELSHAYELAIKDLQDQSIHYTSYIPPKLFSMEKTIRRRIQGIVADQGVILCENQTDYSDFKQIKDQNGVFRVNDFDCVDETAVFQAWIAEEAISIMFKEMGLIKSNENASIKSIFKFRYLWLHMSDSISMYYCGTFVQKSHRIYNSWLCRLTVDFQDFYIQLARFYLAHFQDYARQDRIDLLMHRFQTGYEDPHSQLQLRRRIIFSDYNQTWWIALILILRRFTAPRKVGNFVEFAMAVYWLYAYMLLIGLKVPQELFLRKPKSLLDIDQLPNLENPKKGLAVYIEQLEKNKKTGLRIDTRVRQRSDEHQIHSAIPL